MSDKVKIGSFVHVSFPEFGIEEIEAKVDTGAYRSALHCHDIEVVEEDGKETLYFSVGDDVYPTMEHEKRLHTTHFKGVIVKNSFGQKERRYVITSEVVIEEQSYELEMTLADRANMNFPVLLGRQLLRGNFVVDVELTPDHL